MGYASYLVELNAPPARFTRGKRLEAEENMMKRVLSTLFVTSLILTTSPLSAEQKPGKGGHHPPPPEAIEACESLKVGDPCSFEGRNGEELEGSCFTPSQDKPVACKPSQPPPGEGGGQGGQRQKPCEEGADGAP